jgi:lipid A 3-O-deacylase
VRWDLPLGGTWELTPQFGAGIYSHGRGINLGGAMEFRSGLEISRALGSRRRVGLALFHLSNAGFYAGNPGTEGLVLTYNVRP